MFYPNFRTVKVVLGDHLLHITHVSQKPVYLPIFVNYIYLLTLVKLRAEFPLKAACLQNGRG